MGWSASDWWGPQHVMAGPCNPPRHPAPLREGTSSPRPSPSKMPWCEEKETVVLVSVRTCSHARYLWEPTGTRLRWRGPKYEHSDLSLLHCRSRTTRLPPKALAAKGVCPPLRPTVPPTTSGKVPRSAKSCNKKHKKLVTIYKM